MKERLYNLAWLLLEQGSKVIGSLLITVLVVNHLGVEKFGAFSLSLAILTTLGPIVGLGLDAILFKSFISDKEKTAELLGISLSLRLLSALLVILVVTLLNLASDEPYISLLNVFVVGFIFDAFLGCKDYFLANLKNKYFTYSTLVGTLLQLAILYFLTTSNASPEALASTYILSKAIIAISLSSYYYYDSKTFVTPVWELKSSKELIMQSYPMMLAASIGLLYSLQDQYFIKYFLGDYELGIYSVGIKFVMVLIILPTLISNVLYPGLVSNFNKNKLEYDLQLKGIYVIFFVLGLVLYGFMSLIADPLIELFFGVDFQKSSEILKIYAITLVVSFFQSINNKILVLHDLQHMIFKRAILALIANAILNLLLIPIYGIKGAAFSTVLSEVVVLLSYCINNKTRFIFVYQVRAMCFIDLFSAKVLKSIR